jgi:hypothetical protein
MIIHSRFLFQLVLILTLTLDFIKSTKEIKNILVFSFPGGKSHSFIFKELFDYTTKRIAQENTELEYKFHVIIHNYDMDLWKNTNYNLYGFGDKDKYEDKFQKALEMVREDPVLGYNNFNKAMIHLYEDFLKDNVLEKLNGVKYDLLLSDVVNFITPFLRSVYNIEKCIYLNPTCVFTWLNNAFEYNASYHPVIGTRFSELMNFYERFVNQLFLFGTKISYKYFEITQIQPFREYGYTIEISPFPKDALFLNQCVDGVHYSYSLPPNILNTGAILPKPAKPLQNNHLEDFLKKHESNIYVSQGTITKVLDINILYEVFETFPEIGFVLSLKKELIVNVKPAPKNVLLQEWVSQNDLLGHPMIKLFITHGGVNSILESLYHAKPMIVVGTSIDQVNGAVVVDYRKYGKGITSNSDITKENLIALIPEVLNNPIYKQNVLFAQKLVKEKDGKETFYYWLNYTLEYGYKHLIVPAYSEYNFIQLYNVDVFLILIFLVFILFKLISWGVRRLYRRVCKKTEKNTSSQKKNE